MRVLLGGYLFMVYLDLTSSTLYFLSNLTFVHNQPLNYVTTHLCLSKKVRILSQLRESDLPVGDANRMLCSSSGLLELLPIYRPSVDYIGSKGTREYAILMAYVNVGHTTDIVWLPFL